MSSLQNGIPWYDYSNKIKDVEMTNLFMATLDMATQLPRVVARVNTTAVVTMAINKTSNSLINLIYDFLSNFNIQYLSRRLAFFLATWFIRYLVMMVLNWLNRAPNSPPRTPIIMNSNRCGAVHK